MDRCPLRFSSGCRLFAVLVLAGVWAAAGYSDDGADEAVVILDTASFWRVHYTLGPPVMRKGGAVETVEFPAKWIMRDSPPAPEGWWRAEFDDGAWARFPGVTHGVSSIWGYPHGDAKVPFLARVCMRGNFTVTDPPAGRSPSAGEGPARAQGLTLSASYRGGIVVYLNGVEIARGHLPRGPGVLADDYGEGEAHDRTLPDTAIPPGLLRRGTNVLAIDVHRSPYAEKDIGREKRGGITMDWGSCGLLKVRLKAPKADGVVSNVARPAGFRVWNCLTMKMDTDLDYGDPNEALRPVRIVGTLGGAFSGKVVVGSDGAIKGLRARMSALKRPDGKAVIGASAVQVRYALPDYYQSCTNARYLAPALCFDGLEEFPPAEVPVRVKQPNSRAKNLTSSGVTPSFGAVLPVWVTVNVPTDAAPGEYEGTLTVEAEGEKPVDVPVRLDVSGWKLPAPHEFVTWADIIQSPESVAMQYGVPVWSDAHFRYLDRSLKLLGQVGNKVVYIPLICHTNAGNAETMVRWVPGQDGTYTFDLAPMEKYLDLVEVHLVRPSVVCFYVWDTYLEGGRGGAEQYAGKDTKEARAAYVDRGPLVSVLDAASGKVETTALPLYSTPERSLPLWKPLMEEIVARMRKRGLDKAMMLGISTDNQPTKEVIDFFAKVAPGVPWVSQAHAMPTELHGVPVKYLTGVWAGGRFPADPSEGHTYGWRRTYSGLQSKEFSSPTGAVLAHHPRNLWSIFPVSAFRLVGEMNITGHQRGFARLGGDFWDVVKDKRGGGHPLASRYPETNWRNLDIRSRLLSAGRDGAVSTHRFEMLREGIQECEARIFIERAILEGRIDDDLTRRCQTVLDERIPAIRRGVSTLACTIGWTGHAYIDNSWWQVPGVLGCEWYVGSGWEGRSKALYEAAADVAAHLKEK